MSEVRPAAEERSAPRTWPTWVTMFLILPVGTLTVSMVSILAGALLSEGVNPTEPGAMEAWLTEVVAEEQDYQSGSSDGRVSPVFFYFDELS